jgi:hypothetical protein
MRVIRKTMALSAELWAEIEAYRERIGAVTLAEAVRRLLLAGLKSEGRGK